MSQPQEKLMIIDGNALIHRSFHALPPLTTKSGEIVNAVYGFTSVLIKALREFKPEYVVLTLDRKEKTFRHEQFAGYKAQRVKAPNELYAQIPRVKEIAGGFKIPIFELAGYEADDLIGTLAAKVDGAMDKIIVTGDMDTLQLINSHTKVFTLKRGLTDAMIYDESAVRERYGLAPEQLIDFKALRGDPSDNIPGVKGIGEKTALELLKKFKTLDEVYKYVEEVRSQKSEVRSQEKIRPRIFDLLAQYKGDAFLSRQLATIKCDVKLDFNLEQARFGGFNREALVKLFNQLEFKSLLPRLNGLSEQSKKRLTKTPGFELAGPVGGSEDKFKRNLKLFKYRLIDDEKKFSFFLAKLKKQKAFAFDTETANFDPIAAELLGVSFSWREGEAYYINFQFFRPSLLRQPEAGPSWAEIRLRRTIFPPKFVAPARGWSALGGDPCLPAGTAPPVDNFQLKNVDLFNYKEKEKENVSRVNNEWLKKLKPIFEDEKIKKYGHNIKYDIEVLASLGVEVKGAAADSMVASYLLNPGARQHNLEAVTFNEFNHLKITKEDLLGRGREKIAFGDVPLDKLYNYSCEDADFTNRLVKKLMPELTRQKLDKLFKEIEMPLVLVLAAMEMNGIKIDRDFLAGMGKEVDKKIRALQKKIHDLAGSDFNINSTQQLRQVLFEKLAIPALGVAKGKTGLSTGADELAKLRGLHPIIGLLQDYRELNKLSTTYIEALPRLINQKTGRLHTSFNQAVTATGRLSSTEPNLQNIPVRTELGKRIRQAFVAEPGCKLLSLDYSQIELRLAAHMSGDKKMIRAFKRGEDIHAATAAEINQVALSKVTPEMRREAKAVNFGILYGQGPHGLSMGADIPYARAKEFIDKYFVSYSGVKKFIDKTIALARAKGYTETLFGRRRFLPEINSSVLQARKAAERMAINTPLQGTAADIIKIAMIKISRMIANTSEVSEFGRNERSYPTMPLRMLLQVHDELVFEARNDLAGAAAEKIKKIMEEVIKLKVPIVVEAKQGDNWGEMEAITN
ncbi:DNA polymerase I [Candidatus Falkowbacteria bacterium RIFCSPLOWO2_12_FULL_45_13]|uniref:DNA polymerase I n=1 Tax=Candidatus Falkowbacteria bacterium RIFCSPLOWO2_12_FULL_45_13 TaxID=1797991 RepID=A0A1F5T072_9BACT|nr:MAG: DNA polymerase I [Candidatus Falkowbacteria bacterium RIFCSPLOWO2_12_FULL_45_13]